MEMMVRRNGENNTSFDLVLCDEFLELSPTRVTLDNQLNWIRLAIDLGCKLPPNIGYNTDRDYVDVCVDLAGKWFDRNKDEKFPAPPGLFNKSPYGPYNVCKKCKGFHRLGTHDDKMICHLERYEWDDTTKQMVPKGLPKKFLKVEVIVEFPETLTLDQVMGELVGELDLIYTDSGIHPRYAMNLEVFDTDPNEDENG